MFVFSFVLTVASRQYVLSNLKPLTTYKVTCTGKGPHGVFKDAESIKQIIITKSEVFRISSAKRSGSFIHVEIESNLENNYICNLFDDHGLKVASKNSLHDDRYLSFSVTNTKMRYRVQCSAFSTLNTGSCWRCSRCSRNANEDSSCNRGAKSSVAVECATWNCHR